jgi:NB-ARC domain
MAGPDGVVVQVVHGLGGVGKSTLAARLAAAHAAEYTLTWWITAATPADLDAGLAELAVALQPALTGALPLEALQEGAVQWLAARSGWLVILDNVTDPADVAPLLARAPAGRYLITSRRASGWHATGVVPVRLDVLDAAEAQALLAAILSPDQPREADGAAGLCAELGFLPLAIEQAGAYLAQAGATPREYLGLLARYPAAMYQAAAEGGDAARTIARIWRVTVDRLAGDPLAGQVLRILAWYAPDGIPRTLLDGLADPPAVLRAVGRLAAYNMLTTDAGTLALHGLVQAVTRTPTRATPTVTPRRSTPPGTRPPASSPPPSPTSRTRRAGQAGGCCSRTSTPWPATRNRTPTSRPPPTSLMRPDCSLRARDSLAAQPGISNVPSPATDGCSAPTTHTP